MNVGASAQHELGEVPPPARPAPVTNHDAGVDGLAPEPSSSRSGSCIPAIVRARTPRSRFRKSLFPVCSPWGHFDGGRFSEKCLFPAIS